MAGCSIESTDGYALDDDGVIEDKAHPLAKMINMEADKAIPER
jgi:hypothetical protein